MNPEKMLCNTGYYTPTVRKYMTGSQEKAAVRNLYRYLLNAYRCGNADLNFLHGMSYDQGIEWVAKRFTEYAELCESDPETFKPVEPEKVAITMRKFRKSKYRKSKKKNAQ